MYILNTLLSFPTLKKHKNVSMTSRLMTFNHYLSLPLAIPLPFGDGEGDGDRNEDEDGVASQFSKGVQASLARGYVN